MGLQDTSAKGTPSVGKSRRQLTMRDSHDLAAWDGEKQLRAAAGSPRPRATGIAERPLLGYHYLLAT